MPRPPMVAIIGRKNHGKTTVTVRLAAELTRRGHRVATIKHGSHTFNIDPATTDTYRHYHEGGAVKVAMVAPDKFALIERHAVEPSPEAIAERHMADVDVIVCEGFKRSALPKIEVFRTAVGVRPLHEAGTPEAAGYLAILTDAETLAADVPVLRFADADWLDRLAELVERRVMGRG